jgi:hypothetical protein
MSRKSCHPATTGLSSVCLTEDGIPPARMRSQMKTNPAGPPLRPKSEYFGFPDIPSE